MKQDFTRLGTRLWMRLWTDEQGQSTTEYILILSVVVMVAMKFRQVLNEKLQTILGTVTNNLEKAVQE